MFNNYYNVLQFSRRRILSSSMSPTFDLSLPSTSGYSSRSKSSQLNGGKRGLSSKSSPKKNKLQKLRKNGANNKLSFRNSRRSVNGLRDKSVDRNVETVDNLPKRSRKRIIKEDSDEETEKEESVEHFEHIDEETVDGEIVEHFDSETEVEDDDKSHSKRDGTDTDATEIENDFDERTKTSGQTSR